MSVKCKHLWTCCNFGVHHQRSTIAILEHGPILLEVLLYSGRFFGWSFLPWSLGMFGSRDDHFILLSFLCLFHFCYSLECWASGVCWNIWASGESCHTTMQIQTNTNSLLYLLTICNVICLIIRVLSLHGSIISNTEHKKSQRNTTEAQFSFFLNGFWQPETTRDSTESWSDVQRCEQR